jgi:hypothetical protein
MTVRTPAVVGTFYPADPDELRRVVGNALAAVPRERALAAIVPHAGYLYSGRVAGAVYGRLEVPRDVVILCFSHRGAGKEFAVWGEGTWRTPLGDVPVNAELARRIKEAFLPADFDETGHAAEHSGEVQLPFLQVVRPDVRVVPVSLSVALDARSFAQLRAFGRALARAGGEFLVVASTDLNHYEDQRATVRKDEAVIRAIERLDEEALRETLAREEVSMCGYAPTIAAISYAKARGAKEARTVLHATSGDVSGDYDRVVGYVGMLIPCGS